MVIVAETADANLWSAFPTMLWVALIALVIIMLRKPLVEILGHLMTRIRAGAPMKFGAVQFGGIRAEQHHVSTPISLNSAAPEGGLEAAQPSSGQATPDEIRMAITRQQFKSNSRHLTLVHRLFISTKKGQLYDALIYLVPTRSGSLAAVTRVDYYFGPYWGNQIFSSIDRGRGFPILTSAYGSFLCCARVLLNDGCDVMLFRHIDFEMGAYAPILANESDGKEMEEQKPA